jgi:hypothetical protein
MAFIRRLLFAVTVLPLAGCFQASTVIRVKADGSGTIEQRLLLTDAAVDQMRAFAILSGGDAANADPTSEAQARSLAQALGPGVTYVSSEPVKAGSSQGRDSLYAFTDITKVHVSEQPRLPTGPISPAGAANVGEITFTMTRQPDGNAQLRLQVPKLDVLPMDTSGPNGSIVPPTLQQIQFIKGLLAGARLTVAIEPEGQLVQTSSPFVDGNRVTLVDLDVDKAAADPDLVARLQAAKTADDVKASIKDMPGLKLPLDPEISITFTPK